MINIQLKKGDISQVKTDAIVNAANNHLWMGSGVAGAIKRAGGSEIEQEALKYGQIPIGEAVVTGGGRLPAKHVIHAAVMGQDLQTDAAKIQKATRNSLLRADELGIKSIAFPALGTGVGGFPLDECARIMINEIRDFAADKTSLEKVVLVLHDEDAFRTFRSELEWIERSEPLAE
jgi:O-acetyl-ADP-ribose deacetylase (regulator of RNase III)